jgi:23S rRNA (cytidine1920-2'-O)/16S rRNA (cytidine1409-2'-O)-methyltransferase
MKPRQRVDRLMVERGLFESRARAQAAIAAGHVTANGIVVAKASDEVASDAVIDAAPAHPYVSRGGVKLAAALDHFGFDLAGCTCLDVGASTGGFTDVLLRRGARRVYAVDVGREQLHASLRNNPKVIALERTDIRKLLPTRLVEAPDFVAIDVSFISLRLVLPPALALTRAAARLVALIKPQFEAGRRASKRGIVREAPAQTKACEEVAACVAALGWTMVRIIPSPIQGGDGNREFLIGARRG